MIKKTSRNPQFEKRWSSQNIIIVITITEKILIVYYKKPSSFYDFYGTYLIFFNNTEINVF